MDIAFYTIVLATVMLTFGNWRLGFLAYLVLEFVRDPVRKLTPNAPVLITISVAALWLPLFFGAYSKHGAEMGTIFRRYRTMWSFFWMLFLAVQPGVFMSLLLYQNGALLAMIGAGSYMSPLVGIAVGYVLPRVESDFYRWISLYVFVNLLGMVGTFLEFNHYDWAALGGINMNWIRYHGASQVRLISGFYRSPDVMGMHAAHMIMFCAMLAIRPQSKAVNLWVAISLIAAVCLLLSGRRKMIGMPVTYLAVYLTLTYLVGNFRKTRSFGLVCIASLIAVGFSVAVQLGEVPDEYSEFAASTTSEGSERVGAALSESVLVTIRQSGWLGRGIGTATQGKQYTGETVDKTWQEDGSSRLFVELGIPGAVLIIGAAFYLLRSVFLAFTFIPPGHPLQATQLGLAGVIAANGLSFLVSHQAYSGDPATLMNVALMIGVILGLPRVYHQSRPQVETSPLQARATIMA